MRVFFLRDASGFPVACIASSKAADGNRILFSVSVHNPKDPFNKLVARNVAEGRLERGLAAEVEMPQERGMVKQAVMREISSGAPVLYRNKLWKPVHPRVREAAQRWLDTHNAENMPVRMPPSGVTSA